MRRYLLGGLGIALGAFAPPALAQQPTAQPPARAASFGRPTVASPAGTAPAVTPAGLFQPEAQPAGGYVPGTPAQGAYVPGGYVPGTPVPGGYVPGGYVPGGYVPGASAPGAYVPGAYAPNAYPVTTPVIAQPPGGPAPGAGAPMPMVTPTPPGPTRPPTAGPVVTETRDPTGRIPGGGMAAVPAFPGSVPYGGVPSDGVPYGNFPPGTYVPSVCPDGFACPEPALDDPMFGAAQPAAVDRVRGLGGRTWLTAEVLQWWNRGTAVPPLVTTSSPQFNGIVGQGDTRVLLGGSFGSTYHVGGRIGFGHWFDDCEYYGIDGRLFWVDPSTASFAASVPPYALLARPFVNVNPTAAGVGVGSTSEVVAGPGVANGNVAATLRSTVWGADLNYRRYLLGTPLARLDLLAGFRYLNVSENLTITESFARTPGTDFTVGVPAVSGSVVDSFRTENHFYGGQFGLAGTLQRGRWSLDGRSTIAFGTVYQSAQINGWQNLTFANGATQSFAGGLLTVPGANIGRWSQNKFAVVPEIGLNVGYQLTPRMKVFVGYNFLYLSSAVRPGNAIDQNIDAARVPNLTTGGTPLAQPHPTPQLNTSGYFIQGINFGLTYKW